MSNGRDIFWLAIVNRRDEKLDSLLRRPFLRKVVMRLPNFLQPEHQALRIRARARHERQSRAQSSGACARRFRANRECGLNTRANSVLRQHRRDAIGRFPLTRFGSITSETPTSAVSTDLEVRYEYRRRTGFTSQARVTQRPVEHDRTAASLLTGRLASTNSTDLNPSWPLPPAAVSSMIESINARFSCA